MSALHTPGGIYPTGYSMPAAGQLTRAAAEDYARERAGATPRKTKTPGGDRGSGRTEGCGFQALDGYDTAKPSPASSDAALKESSRHSTRSSRAGFTPCRCGDKSRQRAGGRSGNSPLRPGPIREPLRRAFPPPRPSPPLTKREWGGAV